MTAQIGEALMNEGEPTWMAFCPPIPEAHPRIIALSDEDIENLIRNGTSSILFSTACWRRYRGTWEIRDGRFYLVELIGRFQLRGDDPLFADWFTGVLRIPQGELLEYVHMGFGSVYERELHIKIENGIVTASQVHDNREASRDPWELRQRNLPGGENHFPGDDEL
jgi:hypothetical protein